jgi:hypothetical protein
MIYHAACQTMACVAAHACKLFGLLALRQQQQ